MLITVCRLVKCRDASDDSGLARQRTIVREERRRSVSRKLSEGLEEVNSTIDAFVVGHDRSV